MNEDNLEFIDDISKPLSHSVFLPGLPRKCPRCKTWARYAKPPKNKGCFTVQCKSCFASFEIVIHMKNSRR